MSATATRSHASSASSQPRKGHDAKGRRFTLANAGGPGNPYARQVAALRSALVHCVRVKDMEEIAMALLLQARTGGQGAIKLLFQYVLGKPTEAVDPDRLDIDQWQKLQESARPFKEMKTVLDGLPAQWACGLTNITWPCVLVTALKPLRDPPAAQEAPAAAEAAQAKASGPSEHPGKAASANGAKGAARPAQPSPNGGHSNPAPPAAPSPNGGNGGAQAAAPSPNGRNGGAQVAAPSPNGGNGAAKHRRPSPNGGNGAPPPVAPSPNGANGPWNDAAWRDWLASFDPASLYPPSPNGADGPHRPCGPG
jgi:hypothetical protein